MKFPTLQEERNLWKRGYKNTVCLDEVGRGCLAGPVMAGAVALKISNTDFFQRQAWDEKGLISELPRIRDSKKLTPKTREKLYKILTAHPGIIWGVGKVYPRLIDRINIFQATKLAMKRALGSLAKKLRNDLRRKNRGQAKFAKTTFLILDGNMKLDLLVPQKSIVKADEKVFSCAAASIIAKVKRDKAMLRYHKKYPQYGFDKHKGYGTKHHIKMLKKFGPCAIHRNSFNYYGRSSETKTY